MFVSIEETISTVLINPLDWCPGNLNVVRAMSVDYSDDNLFLV